MEDQVEIAKRVDSNLEHLLRRYRRDNLLTALGGPTICRSAHEAPSSVDLKIRTPALTKRAFTLCARDQRFKPLDPRVELRVVAQVFDAPDGVPHP
jgi:hypothetical protein